MSLSLGRNISSLFIQRQLNDYSLHTSNTYERLSSGQRINKASDDPAGLSMSMSLGNKERILRRAQLNIGDGVSLLNVADSVLDSLSNVVVRMSELAAQAANGVFSSNQKLSLQKEYDQLASEIRRTVGATSFNGINLISGQAQTSASIARISNSSFGGGDMSVKAVSADGNYAVLESGASDNWYLSDRVNGTQERIQSPFGLGNFFEAKVLVNGDVLFSFVDTETNLFYREKSTGITRQLTNSLDVGDISNFDVSADGTRVAFISQTLYSDFGTASSASAGFTNYAYALELATGTIRRLSNSTASQVVLSADGNKYAALGGGVLTAGTIGSGAIASVQTSGLASTSIVGISNSGRTYLLGTGNPTGENGSGAYQFFSVSSNGGISQMTHFTGTAIFSASMSVDGSELYFTSAADLVGQNQSGLFQLYRVETDSRAVTQMTRFMSTTDLDTGANGTISNDGSRIYVTGSDLTYIADMTVTPAATRYDFEVGSGARGLISFDLESAFSAVKGLGAYAITGQIGARGALDAAQRNIGTLNLLRSKIGATQSRLESAGSLTRDQTVSIAAAHARIREADIANEAAQAARLEILMRSGSALLAQANQQPALALTLLRADAE